MKGDRRGFALLAVLWIMVGIGVLAMGVGLAGREAIATTRNRANMTRALWSAESCLSIARATVDRALAFDAREEMSSGKRWIELDRVLEDAPTTPECLGVVDAQPIGLGFDMATLTGDIMRRFLLSRGVPAPAVDTLVDRFLDWRDADDIPRARGAEREWYAQQGRPIPRNGELADVRELRRVRGFETLAHLDSFFTAEPGRILLSRAPLAVIGALPGMTGEAVAALAELRSSGAGAVDLSRLASSLSGHAHATLMLHYAELAPLVTSEPEAWLLRSRVSEGSPPVELVVELRVVRSGSRAAVVRRRSWP